MSCSARATHIRSGLPKRGVQLPNVPFMLLVRATFAVFFALLFVASTNSCALAAAFLEKGDPCCEKERGPGSSRDGVPCSSGTCAQCATLKSGVNLSALVPVSAPVAVWTEDFELSEFLRRLAGATADEIPAAPPDPATIPSPPWRDVLKKALPVRGPSLAV